MSKSKGKTKSTTGIGITYSTPGWSIIGDAPWKQPPFTPVLLHYNLGTQFWTGEPINVYPEDFVDGEAVMWVRDLLNEAMPLIVREDGEGFTTVDVQAWSIWLVPANEVQDKTLVVIVVEGVNGHCFDKPFSVDQLGSMLDFINEGHEEPIAPKFAPVGE